VREFGKKIDLGFLFFFAFAIFFLMPLSQNAKATLLFKP
jgi:hypothetical protein